jgi:hypothetical protein
MALIDSIIGGELNSSIGDDLPPSPCRDDTPNPSLRSTDDDDNNDDDDEDDDEDEVDCGSPKSRNSKQLYRLSELELKNTLG